MKRNVIVLGSGCAGNTAALYAARASLQPLVICGHEPGGQLTMTSRVENFPGFPDGIDGPDLVENIKKQASRFGAEYLHGAVEGVDFRTRPLRVNVEGTWIEAEAVIVATGASARWLGLASEQALIGRGVSSCATCDGFLFHGRKIMVVGGGDSAMEEANFLSRFGSEVTLVHRRGTFRASKIMEEQTRANPKVRFLTSTVVEDVLDVGRGVVTGVRLHNTVDGRRWEQDVDGLFVAIGHVPNTAPFEGKVELDPDGYLVSKGGARTSADGVFHAGDVEDRVYRQAITAAAAGCRAAMDVERYLDARGH